MINRQCAVFFLRPLAVILSWRGISAGNPLREGLALLHAPPVGIPIEFVRRKIAMQRLILTDLRCNRHGKCIVRRVWAQQFSRRVISLARHYFVVRVVFEKCPRDSVQSPLDAIAHFLQNDYCYAPLHYCARLSLRALLILRVIEETEGVFVSALSSYISN